MLKKVALILIIVSSIAFMLWSSNYIYNKQSKGIDFNSFVVKDSASILYIPNSNQFLKRNINLTHLSNFNLPNSISKGLEIILPHSDYDFNSEISAETYISFFENDYTIVFKNYDLSIVKIIKQLSALLNITAIAENEQLNINELSFYYKKSGDFFIFSNQPISPKQSLSQINTQGNFDYSFQKHALAQPTFYKDNLNESYIFSRSTKDSLLGKSVNPSIYFHNIPNNFDELYFYGSTRIEKDIQKLTSTNQPNSFFSWTKNSITHIKKDSFEIILGIQNNLQNLKYILDEQTLELSDDSLLPTPIFKNNFEINFFESNYDWQSILPESTQSFSVYMEVNNINILATSIVAMDWYIKEMQLGNTYANRAKNISIPSKVNKLYIDQRTENQTITIDNWITKTNCFHTSISLHGVTGTSSSSLPLISNFLIKDSKSQLYAFYDNDSLNLLIYDDQGIDCYTKNGKLKWNLTLPSSLIKPPVKIDVDGNSFALVLFMENQVNIINSDSKSLSGFPYNYNGSSKDGIILQYEQKSDFRILINVNNTIINIDINGNPVEGWNSKPFTGQLNSRINYSKTNGKDYIYFKDSKDTLHVLNRKGENRFLQNFKFSTYSPNEFITGDITKGNLRLLSYEANYIKSNFLADGHRDSLPLNKKVSPIHSSWITTNGKVKLLIEEFDKVVIFNEFGLLEDEIQKPQANLTLVTKDFLKTKPLVFGNLTKNELYLLSSFGNQINTNPIIGNNNFTIIDNYLIVYFNSQIWIYKLA